MDKVVFLEEQIKTLKRRLNSPKVDLLETENTVIVRCELAYRFFKWELKDNHVLFVSTDKKTDFNGDLKVIYTETKYGPLSRRIKLSSKVINEPIRTEYNDGILILEFNKMI